MHDGVRSVGQEYRTAKDLNDNCKDHIDPLLTALYYKPGTKMHEIQSSPPSPSVAAGKKIIRQSKRGLDRVQWDGPFVEKTSQRPCPWVSLFPRCSGRVDRYRVSKKQTAQ